MDDEQRWMQSSDYILTVKGKPDEEMDEADQAQINRAFGYKSQFLSKDSSPVGICYQVRCNICFERHGVDLTVIHRIGSTIRKGLLHRAVHPQGS